MIDITELLLEQLENFDGEEIIHLDIENEKFIVVGEIIIDDNRTWTGPEYDSSDGLPTRTSGVVDFDSNIDVIDYNTGDVLDFEFDVIKISDFLNN